MLYAYVQMEPQRRAPHRQKANSCMLRPLDIRIYFQGTTSLGRCPAEWCSNELYVNIGRWSHEPTGTSKVLDQAAPHGLKEACIVLPQK